MPKRKFRRRRRRSDYVSGSRHVFAVVSSGKTLTCNADSVHFPSDRPIRVTHVTGDAVMSKGINGLVEVVLYNQAETNIASSTVKTVCTAHITRFKVFPPKSSDMWIDPGRTQVPSTKILHIDFPCISKSFEGYAITINLMIHYVAGPEQIENVCPAVLLSDPENDSVHLESLLSPALSTNELTLSPFETIDDKDELGNSPLHKN